VVEDRQFLGCPQGIPGRQHQTERGEFNPFRPRGEVGVEQQRGDRGFIAFGMKMMLCRRHDVKTGFVSKHRELTHLLQHLLVALVVAADGSKGFSLCQSAGNGGEHEQHEFHGEPPSLGG
jgi:hypothetical protein